MIQPDLTNRQECCGAPAPDHWTDCPTQAERQADEEREREEARVRMGHSLMTTRCRCGICSMAEHL